MAHLLATLQRGCLPGIHALDALGLKGLHTCATSQRESCTVEPRVSGEQGGARGWMVNQASARARRRAQGTGWWPGHGPFAIIAYMCHSLSTQTLIQPFTHLHDSRRKAPFREPLAQRTLGLAEHRHGPRRCAGGGRWAALGGASRAVLLLLSLLNRQLLPLHCTLLLLLLQLH